MDESRKALQYAGGAATRIGWVQAKAFRHDLPVAGPKQDSADMDALKTLFSSEPTFISAQDDVASPSFVVAIAASLCQLGTLNLLFDARPVVSRMDFVKEAIF